MKLWPRILAAVVIVAIPTITIILTNQNKTAEVKETANISQSGADTAVNTETPDNQKTQPASSDPELDGFSGLDAELNNILDSM